MITVLIVDDTSLFRTVIRHAMEEIPGVEVVGTAPNGRLALTKIQDIRPQLVTLDLEMPDLDGIGVLKAIKERGLDVGVVVVSNLTRKGGELTMKALELGAFDFVTKPEAKSPEEAQSAIRDALKPVITGYQRMLEVRSLLHGKAEKTPETAPQVAKSIKPEFTAVRERMARLTDRKADLVLIGISTGGPNALKEMLPKLPKNLNVPVLIVQHMPAGFTKALAARLNDSCPLEVKEAEDGEPALPNQIYIAPGGKQMKIEPGQERPVLRLTDDPPENHCRPSVDYLFRSVANAYPGRAVAVIMTGMGNDGTLGARLLKRTGSFTIAQDMESCVVFGMPKEAIQSGAIDVVAPLGTIAEEICKRVLR